MILVNELGDIFDDNITLNDGVERNVSDFTEQELLEKFSLRIVTDEAEHSELIKEHKKNISEKIRAKRDALLSQTDWTQMPDSPLTEEEKQNYRIYRQSLRDLPAKYDTININEVTFPILGEI